MKEITASGQTVEEAVQSALEQLNTTRDQVELEVIDEGKKGLLGVFGSKPAIVKITIQTEENPEVPVTEEEPAVQAEDPVQLGKNFIDDVITKMNVTVDVSVEVNDQYITYNLEGESIGMLIGKRGQTLNAMQYLVHLVVNKTSDTRYAVILDAEGYRGRRQESLEALAGKMADKAVNLNRKVALEPMPAFERKIIHNALQRNDQVSTYSDGHDPHRHVVITPIDL